MIRWLILITALFVPFEALAFEPCDQTTRLEKTLQPVAMAAGRASSSVYYADPTVPLSWPLRVSELVVGLDPDASCKDRIGLITESPHVPERFATGDEAERMLRAPYLGTHLGADLYVGLPPGEDSTPQYRGALRDGVPLFTDGLVSGSHTPMDTDGDGAIDYVVMQRSNGQLEGYVLRGFRSSWQLGGDGFTPSATAAGAGLFAVGDPTHGDGAGKVLVYSTHGQGLSARPVQTLTGSNLVGPDGQQLGSSLALMDWDGDGKQDLLMVARSDAGDQIHVHRGEGETFSESPAWRLDAGQSSQGRPVQIAAARMSCDEGIGLVVNAPEADRGQGTITYHRPARRSLEVGYVIRRMFASDAEREDVMDQIADGGCPAGTTGFVNRYRSNLNSDGYAVATCRGDGDAPGYQVSVGPMSYRSDFPNATGVHRVLRGTRAMRVYYLYGRGSALGYVDRTFDAEGRVVTEHVHDSDWIRRKTLRYKHYDPNNAEAQYSADGTLLSEGKVGVVIIEYDPNQRRSGERRETWSFSAPSL